MIDLKVARTNAGPVRAALARRGPGPAEDFDRALKLDAAYRGLTARVEGLRAEQNRGSKAVARAADPAERARLIEGLRGTSDELKDLETQMAAAREELDGLLARIPNPPHESVPDGQTDEDAVELRRWGDPPVLDFEARDHQTLGEMLGVIDMERGSRTSGARFGYLTGPAARIQMAIVRLAFDFTRETGHLPVIPPVLVRREAMFGTGFLPTDEAQIYATREEDLYLAGTAEVPLAAMHMGEILDQVELPKRYVGYSTCFRREAGTYGKDMRGIFRVHQFDKLEMFSFVMPEESWEEHERLIGWEERWVQGLGLPYRVVNIPAGDLGASAAKKYDIEAWFPSQGRYRELTSASNTTDFQARRLECRVRTPQGNRPLHTLNATLCAIGRTFACLLENGQRADGSVAMPESLHPYLFEEDRVLRPVSTGA